MPLLGPLMIVQGDKEDSGRTALWCGLPVSSRGSDLSKSSDARQWQRNSRCDGHFSPELRPLLIFQLQTVEEVVKHFETIWIDENYLMICDVLWCFCDVFWLQLCSVGGSTRRCEILERSWGLRSWPAMFRVFRLFGSWGVIYMCYVLNILLCIIWWLHVCWILLWQDYWAMLSGGCDTIVQVPMEREALRVTKWSVQGVHS